MMRACSWMTVGAIAALQCATPAYAAGQPEPSLPEVEAVPENADPTEEPTSPDAASPQPEPEPETQPEPETTPEPETQPAPTIVVERPQPTAPVTTPEPPSADESLTVEQRELQRPDGVGFAKDIKGKTLHINPFIAAVGGGYYEHIDNTGTEMSPDRREDRFTTVALSRLGVRAHYGEVFSLVSELEFNAGPYGTSVWEGQAAIQVRNQLMRLQWRGLRVDAGRITDPTSLDFVSFYAVGNLLLTDDFARDPLLYSGFNRGNGLHISYGPEKGALEGLRLGLTANAGNPTSTTGTVMIGGTFPPFSRFYQVPWSEVGRDARGFPTPTFHVYLVSPSLRYDHKYASAQFSGQWFQANTNTNTRADAKLEGYNLRGGFVLKFWDGRIRPFANGSRVLNDVVDPNDTALLSDEKYQAITANAGLDVLAHERLGVGMQYNLIHEQQGAEGPRLGTHYANVGASFKILPFLDLDARYALGYECRGLTRCELDRRHRMFVTLKALLGDLGGSAGRP